MSVTTLVGLQNLKTTICRNLTGCASEWNLHCWSDVPNYETLKEDLYKKVLERVTVLSGGEDVVAMDLLQLWVDEAKDFFDRLSELSLLFGLDVSVQSHDELYQGWKVLHAAGLLIPNIKYSVNVAFNRHFGDLEMPEEKHLVDLGMKLFPKTLRIALGRLRSSEKRWRKKSLYLVNSLFQGWKKGLLPLDIPAFDKTMEKHRLALCETNGDVDEEILDDVYRITSDLLRGFRFRAVEEEGKLPSTSATIEFSRADGGSFRSLVNEWYGKSGNGCLIARALDSSISHLSGYIRLGEEVKEVRAYGPTAYELKEKEKSHLLSSILDPLEVLPYGVLEPLKIRTITRPSYRTHWGLRSIQSQLLQFLNGFKSFRITGDSNREHLSAHIQPVVQENAVKLTKLISGDFQGATDTLKAAVTKVVWEVIGTKGIPWWAYYKGLNSLCNTKIYYDDRCMPKIEKTSPYRNFQPTRNLEVGTQSNGQLMGNILSFPILCIANYCAYHMAVETYEDLELRVWDVMKRYPVRVNGDDILFRADSELYRIWRCCIKDVGFSLSLGKNFAHSGFCQINSQLFRVRYDIFGVPVGSERIPFFNFGQLTGRKKGMASEDCRINFHQSSYCDQRTFEEKVQELGSVSKNFSDLSEGCPSDLLPSVNKLKAYWFVRRYGGIVSSGNQLPLLTLPPEMGGLGLDFGSETRKLRKKYNSFDFCSSFFMKEQSWDREFYSNMFALSHLTPFNSYLRVSPKYDIMCPVRSDTRNWICDHVVRGKFSLVL